MPVSSLAPQLGVSRATVRSRIDRLLETGAIQGFTVAMGNAPRPEIRAIMMVKVDGKAANSVFGRLKGFPEVRALHSTNGQWDIVAEIEVPNLEAFDSLLSQIRTFDGISATETSILLASRKSI